MDAQMKNSGSRYFLDSQNEKPAGFSLHVLPLIVHGASWWPNVQQRRLSARLQRRFVQLHLLVELFAGSLMGTKHEGRRSLQALQDVWPRRLGRGGLGRLFAAAEREG